MFNKKLRKECEQQKLLIDRLNRSLKVSTDTVSAARGERDKAIGENRYLRSVINDFKVLHRAALEGKVVCASCDHALVFRDHAECVHKDNSKVDPVTGGIIHGKCEKLNKKGDCKSFSCTRLLD